MLFSIIKWSDIIVHFNLLYSEDNLKKMGQISAKCGIACARGNNISWYYAVVNVYLNIGPNSYFEPKELVEQKSAMEADI